MPAASTSASWTPAEETAFVNYLYDHEAEAGDGGNFKSVTFQNALPTISPLWVKGAKKTVKRLQNKYSTVCPCKIIQDILILYHSSQF